LSLSILQCNKELVVWLDFFLSTPRTCLHTVSCIQYTRAVFCYYNRFGAEDAVTVVNTTVEAIALAVAVTSAAAGEIEMTEG
jgi:hypothetical protein